MGKNLYDILIVTKNTTYELVVIHLINIISEEFSSII